MPNEELQKRLNQMVYNTITNLKRDLAKEGHPILKLIIIARYEGYGIALKELGADTSELGALVETDARKIEPSIRQYFK